MFQKQFIFNDYFLFHCSFGGTSGAIGRAPFMKPHTGQYVLFEHIHNSYLYVIFYMFRRYDSTACQLHYYILHILVPITMVTW